MGNRTRCLLILGALMLFVNVQPSQAKTRETKEWRKKFKAAQQEKASLKEQLAVLGECTTRVSQLEYHNKALDMIISQQLPAAQERTSTALSKLKTAAADEEGLWLSLTCALLVFVASVSQKAYSYIQQRVAQDDEQTRREKAQVKADRNEKRRK